MVGNVVINSVQIYLYNLVASLSIHASEVLAQEDVYDLMGMHLSKSSNMEK